MPKITVTVERWRAAIIIRVNKEECFVSEKFGNKYNQASFVVEMDQYREPVSSEFNVWEWSPLRSEPKNLLLAGSHIVFETSNNLIVGWCSYEEYQTECFKSLRKTVKKKCAA